MSHFTNTNARHRAADRTRAGVALLLASLAPGVASASNVVLTPLAPGAGVEGKAQLAVHQLIASELEFQPDVSDVTELDARPPQLTDACLAQTSCLASVTKAAGGEQLIAGTMATAGGEYVLDLVYYDLATNRVVRRKPFRVPQDATEMANAMTGVLRELLTGQGAAPEPGAAAVAAAESFEQAEEEVFDLDAPLPAAAPVDPLAGVPEIVDLDAPEEKGRGRNREPEPAPVAPAVAVAPAPQPAIDAASITFGGSVEDITAEQIDQMIQFGAPATAIATAEPAYAPPQPAYTPPPPAHTAPQATPAVADLDAPQSAPSRARAQGPAPSHEGARHLQITARGGYSKYYAFDFVTAGAEVAVPVAGGVHAVAGIEVYSVNRTLPIQLQVLTNQITDWDHIFPMNAGLLYKFLGGIAQPYVGADLIVAQYYSDDIGSDWAGGGRARVGCDVMLASSFGLNVNAAVGGWTGGHWSLIEQGVGNTGFLPQVSAGTVLAF